MNIDFSELMQSAENFQPLKDWGFTLSTKQEGDPVSWLVYKSQWCKIKIHHRRDFHQQVREDSLNIYYGRVHALDDSLTMEHEGQMYHCWLSSVDWFLVCAFLDGQSPEETFNTIIGRPEWFEEYLANAPISNNNEGEARLIYHKGYWDHYGLRLFELLDIRRPDLWDEYINFLKEYAKLKYAKEEVKAKLRKQVFKIPEIPLYQRI